MCPKKSEWESLEHQQFRGLYHRGFCGVKAGQCVTFHRQKPKIAPKTTMLIVLIRPRVTTARPAGPHTSLLRCRSGSERCLPLIHLFNGSIADCSSSAPAFSDSAIPFMSSALPSGCSASAALARSCSIKSIARARTRSSLSSKARINGSTDPGGADCAHVSSARSRVPTSGESSSLAIHAGTTKDSGEFSGLVDGTDTARGLSPRGTVSFPKAELVPSTEAMGTGLAAGATGATGLLSDDGPCLERGGPFTLARGPRFDALSGEVCPQPASPVRSIRLRRNARHDRDGRMFSDRSGGAQMIRCVDTGGIVA